MNWAKIGRYAALSALVAAAPSNAKDGKWDLFPLFGQSNMAGPPMPEAMDKATNPRIEVLVYDNCSAVGRAYGEWYLASMREFDHRYRAAMVPYLKTGVSQVLPCASGSGIAGLRMELSREGMRLHSQVPLDRVFPVSSSGKIHDIGSGTEIRIDARRFPSGVYVLQAFS